MYLALARSLNQNLNVSGPQVFAFHPMQLSRFLEQVWANRPPATTLPSAPGLEVPGALATQEATSGVPLPASPLLWEHLIYAYMVENTRAYEIFRRVLEEYLYGERLGTPSMATQQWLRTTEQLFYGPDPPLQIFALTSFLRPDIRAARRNTYFRMFGMDLNHGTDDNRPYPYPRASASNTNFVSIFEGLLREVWRGIENFRNSSGPADTDDTAIANYARELDDMLSVRRTGGNLAREELLHSSAMSWFDLTLQFDSPVVVDLEAQANSREERLLRIGQRVGLPAHSRSGQYFKLADNMSFILRNVELGQFSTPANAQILYTPSPPAPFPAVVSNAMQEIIRDWSIATGREMKTRPVSVVPPQPKPIRPRARPIRAPVPGGGGNGRVPAGGEPSPV
jgi:hypothetical protein